MHVLFVTPEIAPYVAASQRADAVAGLVCALAGEGVQVTVIAPFYRGATQQHHSLARRLRPTRVVLGSETADVFLYEGKLGTCDARILLLDHPSFSDTPAAVPLGEDARPFALFARAALQAAVDLSLGVELIHAHDWQSGLVPLVAHRFADRPEIRDLPVVFTIHRPDEPGDFSRTESAGPAWIDETDLDSLASRGNHSLLSTGILFSDEITTDSPATARLFQSHLDEGSLKMTGAPRLSTIVGVLPGLNYQIWNSATSRHIAAGYDATSMAHKTVCKAELLEELGLKARPGAPLLALVAPFDGLGASLVLDQLDAVEAAGVQLALVGLPEGDLVETMAEAARSRPNLLAALAASSGEATLQRALSGADALFMAPESDEATTLALQALSFGCVPVAYPSGGLGNVLVDFDRNSETGTALLVAERTPAAAAHALHRLRAIFDTEPAWRALQRSALRQRFEWNVAASRYVSIYRDLLAEALSDVAASG